MEKTKLKTIALLTVWSKWLITINIFAGTGCVVVLKSLDETRLLKVGGYLFSAIICFAAAVVCATLFNFLMIGETANTGANDTQVKYTWLAKIQWLLFTAGLVCLLVWIAVLSKMVA